MVDESSDRPWPPQKGESPGTLGPRFANQFQPKEGSLFFLCPKAPKNHPMVGARNPSPIAHKLCKAL
jgi:hypothetical protein